MAETIAGHVVLDLNPIIDRQLKRDEFAAKCIKNPRWSGVLDVDNFVGRPLIEASNDLDTIENAYRDAVERLRQAAAERHVDSCHTLMREQAQQLAAQAEELRVLRAQVGKA